MRAFAVCSGKGGVGKTTVTATVAVALSKAGHSVLVVDLDPQNSLRFHLGLSAADGDGLAAFVMSEEGKPAARLPVFESDCGARVIPYGDVCELTRLQFEAALSKSPYMLERLLESLRLPANTIVLIDTPPGPSLYLQQAIRFVDRALLVLLADAASFATAPRMIGLFKRYAQEAKNNPDLCLVVNQANPLKELSEDILLLLRSDYPREYLCSIHQDQSVTEAIAFRRTVIDHDERSQAAHDFTQLAHTLLER